MSQRNRLRLLQMGKARHNGPRVLFHQPLQYRKKLPHQTVNPANLISRIKLHVQSHLIIPAAPCMELLSRIAYAVNQRRFHKAVDVFIFVADLKLPALNVA